MKAVLLGHPVSHSRSPELFAALAAAGGPRIEFHLLDVAPADLGAALQRLREGHWQAAGVTIPYKQEVLDRLDDLAPSALAAGAVNAVALRDGRLVGANTDGAGFLRALAAAFPGEGVGSAVLLGAGGAARGVGAALRAQGVRVTVVTRDPEARGELLEQAAHELLAWSDPTLVERVRASDLVVQATPLGMSPAVDGLVPLPMDALAPGQRVADLVYTPWQTRFLRLARARGCRAVNGWPMLVHQAAVAVDHWLQPGAGDGLPEAVRQVEARDPLAGDPAMNRRRNPVAADLQVRAR